MGSGLSPGQVQSPPKKGKNGVSPTSKRSIMDRIGDPVDTDVNSDDGTMRGSILDRLGIANEEDDFHFNPEDDDNRGNGFYANEDEDEDMTAFASLLRSRESRNYANNPDSSRPAPRRGQGMTQRPA